MNIIIHPHAQVRLLERGVSMEEIAASIESGEQFEAKYGRMASVEILRSIRFGEAGITPTNKSRCMR